jgi:hypothetical protein
VNAVRLITIAGRAYEVRYGLWPIANDTFDGRRIVAVDLIAPAARETRGNPALPRP